MRTRALLATGATALLVGALPLAAAAQDTTSDPEDLDGTFVPSGPDTGEADGTTAPASDDLPSTGGGLAVLGGLAVTGGAILHGRRS